MRPPSAPGPDLTQEEVIIPQGGIGTIRIVGGAGGNLVRSQQMRFYGRSKNSFQVAKFPWSISPLSWRFRLAIIRLNRSSHQASFLRKEPHLTRRLDARSTSSAKGNLPASRTIQVTSISAATPSPTGTLPPVPQPDTGLGRPILGSPLESPPGPSTISAVEAVPLPRLGPRSYRLVRRKE